MGILAIVALILLAFNVNVYCETFLECNDIGTKTFVADRNDCESYIYCDDEESFTYKCPTGQRFNENDGICDDAENVECNSDREPSEITTKIATTATTTTTSTTTAPTAVSTTKTSKPTPSTSEATETSPSSIKTSPTSSSINPTLPPSSSTITTTVSSSTTSPNGPIVCPTPSNPEEIIYLSNSESCSEYYMCYRGSPIPMTCPRDLEFNSLTGSCDWARLANCKTIETTTSSPRKQCTGQISGYFKYPSNCHYYYRCMNGMLIIQECPSGFGWDAEKKICSSTACRK